MEAECPSPLGQRLSIKPLVFQPKLDASLCNRAIAANIIFSLVHEFILDEGSADV